MDLFRRGRIISHATTVLIFLAFCSACGGEERSVYDPIFTDPEVKLSETAVQQFSQQLYEEAVAYEPLLAQSGTQVHMGYWSAAGNHGSLVRVLDAINSSTPMPGESVQRAIWDEGATSSLQYPAYVTMLEEHWYERKDAVDGIVTIYGEQYADPYGVTMQIADDIWGQYSQRYADMATLIKGATGNAVHARCFVEGAKRSRIFYTYELPELRILEQAGAARVFFAKTQDAVWTNPDDWTEGTENAPEPIDASAGAPSEFQFSASPLTGGAAFDAAVAADHLRRDAYDLADAYRDGMFGVDPYATDTVLQMLSERNPGCDVFECAAALADALRATAF